MTPERETFGIGGLVARNVRHYWRTNLAVVLGCAIAVAALVGSLLVGGSVRGSLRDVALERLGSVEYLAERSVVLPHATGGRRRRAAGHPAERHGQAGGGRGRRAGRLRRRHDRRLLVRAGRAAAEGAERPAERHARPRPRRDDRRRRAADGRQAGERTGRLPLRAAHQRRDDARAAAGGGRRHPRAGRRPLQPAAGPAAAAQPLRRARLAPGADRAAGQGEHDPGHERPGRGAGEVRPARGLRPETRRPTRPPAASRWRATACCSPPPSWSTRRRRRPAAGCARSTWRTRSRSATGRCPTRSSPHRRPKATGGRRSARTTCC